MLVGASVNIFTVQYMKDEKHVRARVVNKSVTHNAIIINIMIKKCDHCINNKWYYRMR